MKENTTSYAGAVMNCKQVTRNEIAEKYLLGQLNQADRESYELHYFECAHCFEELQTYQVVQTQLRRSAAAIRAEALPRGTAWRWAWVPVAATAMLVVSVGIWKGWLRHSSDRRPQVAVQTTQQAPTNTPSLDILAAVEPPRYVPIALRGNEDDATRKFQLAMKQYLKGNFAAAIPGLRAALKTDPDTVDARFYLGISELLSDQTDQAAQEFRRTIALGDSPYLEGAHFYLAKAYIRKNDLAAAEGELKRTIEIKRGHGDEAEKLLQQLRRLGKIQH